jgi:hypothetical protein
MPAQNPNVRTADARAAALTRHRGAQHQSTLEARRDAEALRLEDYIKRVVDAAPPLTPAQRDRLALLLRGGQVA